jgi:hypothetical protein
MDHRVSALSNIAADTNRNRIFRSEALYTPGRPGLNIFSLHQGMNCGPG